MKLNCINGQKLKNGLAWPLLAVGFVVANYSAVNSAEKTNNEKSKAEIYIKTHNPELYKELKQGYNDSRTFNWEDEAKKLELSLKMDSIAKTNYALGMQAVRDSLANANK